MILRASLALLGVGLLIYWTEPPAVFSVLERVTPNLVYRVHTDRPLVALSFDDGPDPTFTPQVLQILERYGAKATFFLIGERALRRPDVVARIKAAGHEVGNHYFMNGATLPHSEAEFCGYLERTEAAVGISTRPKLFRPPGGPAWPGQLKLARARGYICVLGSAYPHDPGHPPVWYTQWLIEKNLAPGIIVILHDGISDPTRGIQALPHILAAGNDRGLQFVSIGALMRVAAGQAIDEVRDVFPLGPVADRDADRD
jgi:peptidoglycan/xylan/chitin deacetylase (PgdA/CDA1 family)